MRSTTSVEGRGSSIFFGSRSCKRLVQACCESQMLGRGDCEHWNPPPPLLVTDSVICEVCSRSFRRSSVMKRHKCVAERCLPVQMQRGARQCGTCSLWFASVGGLTVYRCLEAQSASASSLCPCTVLSLVHRCCQHIVLCFRSSTGYRRHNCNRGKSLTGSDRLAFALLCARCCRSFRRSQDLSRHMANCKGLLTP